MARRALIKPGSRLKAPLDFSLLKRFLSKVHPVGDCWEWAAGTDDKGYGQFWFDGRAHWAHRISYALFVRTIPAGSDVDHRCHNRKCVNPSHLVATTRAINSARKPPKVADDAVAPF